MKMVVPFEILWNFGSAYRDTPDRHQIFQPPLAVRKSREQLARRVPQGEKTTKRTFWAEERSISKLPGGSSHIVSG